MQHDTPSKGWSGTLLKKLKHSYIAAQEQPVLKGGITPVDSSGNSTIRTEAVH